MEDNKNIDTTQVGSQEQPTLEEKTFTQEEVNRIVQERLARSKNKEQVNSGENDKETELKARELNVLAREKLLDCGLTKELAPLLKGVSDEKELDERIKVLESFVTKKTDEQEVNKGFKPMGAPNNSTEKQGDTAIRHAMGL